MTHHLVKSGYTALVDRINRFPQGAPPSDTLYKILKFLFIEKDAALVSLLPIKPFTVEKAARIWKMKTLEAQKILDDLADRAILLIWKAMENKSMSFHRLWPFFKFSLMRIRKDIDQHTLSKLFYQYLNVEEDFIKAPFTEEESRLGRVFVHKPALSAGISLCVLDYERATDVIKTASCRGISICYCRHKMQHLVRDCNAPKDICMTFNVVARSLIKHGHSRTVSMQECLDLLTIAYDQKRFSSVRMSAKGSISFATVAAVAVRP